ncbi:MAG TPA: bifunctional diaminohydroxyphosphoribosylaminopyrimidine deaminase/5-amino-6-(5-phosphoribosylamino)uracil reductase RibD [Verrucomicrobiae bacterium]|jgi:diaminohydroxyphosphoribosylaminopyrimidine deaminase/5-amino-6-(5-phosphoribosylamino)uracil reductase|nr:bifunctional diaminohydroxyphosphoribosylaminopyrimidine deaminase/5-amino-6-(5-phosphoribosylamino)uracil reductase RibD [Verrucomicrobiae bacterium]
MSAMSDIRFMRLALRLARKGYGSASPNPMVGAVLVKGGKIIGRGWHRRAGLPHGEIEALHNAQKHGHNPRGATLYVTLEPCSTHGRTPPCTEAIIAAGIKRVVIGAIDPNPNHAGKALKILKRAGVDVLDFRTSGTDGQKISDQCVRLNEAFNHWIVHRTPVITVKAAMTLDGKIATASGESKWITGEQSREFAMNLRRGADAILVGVNTILADDPSLTVRTKTPNGQGKMAKPLRRIVLDSLARTPPTAKVVSDEFAALTTIVATKAAPKKRVAALARQANVLVAPRTRISLPWLLKKLGAENVTHLLVEGGGEVNSSFLFEGLAQRIAFFYAPRVLGGRDARKAVGGEGVQGLDEIINLREPEWRTLGKDLFLTARVSS